MPSEALSRREAIATILQAGAGGAAALTLAGCEKPQPTVATSRSIAELGEGTTFVDSNGNPVNIDAMTSSLQGKPSTLSFMFAACGDICPLTASGLAELSRTTPSLKHVVVSVDPHGDFSNGNLKEKLTAQGLTTGPNGNTIILYPTSDGTTNGASLLMGGSIAQDIQNRFDLIINPSNAGGHSGAVTLFGADGRLVAQAMDTSSIVPILEPKLAAMRQR